MITVEITNEQSDHVFDCDLLQAAVRLVLEGESVLGAEVSVAIVDDNAIQLLNRKYLGHDYATDVLSFLLSAPGEPLDGEIVVSAETAAREASQYGWTTVDEMLLYVIHGTLHLAGYDDASDEQRAAMRAKERRYLMELGRQPSGAESVAMEAASSDDGHSAEGEPRS